MATKDENKINDFMAREDLRLLMLESSPCGVLVVDKTGTIIAYNDLLKRHWAVRHLVLLKRKVRDVFPQENQTGRSQSHVELLWNTLRTGRPFNKVIEIWTGLRDTFFTCRFWSRAIRDSKGNIIGAYGVYYDLTPYRKKKEQLEHLSRALADTNVQAVNQHMETIRAFANAIAARDNYTRWHSEKVAEYAQQICFNMGMASDIANNAYLAGLLHDVGKIGVPEDILTKPGRLNDQEYELIKKHPEIGVGILGSMRNMQEILHVIKHHHERYDGRGYPNRLEGEQIPLLSRVLAVADSFEAMTSDRSYRAAFPMARAIEEIRVNAGSQFDPRVVHAFIELVEQNVLTASE